MKFQVSHTRVYVSDYISPLTFVSNNGFIYQTKDNQKECSGLNNWFSLWYMVLGVNHFLLYGGPLLGFWFEQFYTS